MSDVRVNFGNGQVHDCRSVKDAVDLIKSLDSHRDAASVQYYEAGTADDPGRWIVDRKATERARCR